MFSIFVLAAFLVCANGAVLQPVPMLDGRIVGGNSIEISEAPYQVALLYDREGLGVYLQECGGSIISRTVVVTAAHCTDGTLAAQWNVRAGSTYHNTGGQVIQVVKFTKHPGYNSRNDNDIALAFLATKLVLGTDVAIITLPSQGARVPEGAEAVVTGWGVRSQGGPQPASLNKVVMPFVDQWQCANAFTDFNPVTSNMICAGNYGTGGKDACQGDTGGPLIVHVAIVGEVLVGITSWGRGCGDAKYPGVYTRVPVYREWIDSHM